VRARSCSGPAGYPALIAIDSPQRKDSFTNLQLVEGIVNLGDSEQYGLEAELTFQATKNLNLSASVGIIEAEWKDGTLVDLGAGNVDLGGTTVPYTNDVSWVLAARYDQPLSWWNGVSLITGAQLSHNGEFEGLYAWDTVRNPDYTLLNLQLGLRAERWEFLVQVENVTDEDYFTDVTRFPNLHAIDGGETINIGTLGQPRIITGSISYRF